MERIQKHSRCIIDTIRKIDDVVESEILPQSYQLHLIQLESIDDEIVYRKVAEAITALQSLINSLRNEVLTIAPYLDTRRQAFLLESIALLTEETPGNHMFSHYLKQISLQINRWIKQVNHAKNLTDQGFISLMEAHKTIGTTLESLSGPPRSFEKALIEKKLRTYRSIFSIVHSYRDSYPNTEATTSFLAWMEQSKHILAAELFKNNDLTLGEIAALQEKFEHIISKTQEKYQIIWEQ